MDTLKYYLYYFDSIFTGYAPVIRITVFIVTLLIIVCIAFLFQLFFINNKIKKKNKRWENMKEQYGEKFKKVLFSSEDMSREEIKNRTNITINDCRKKWQKELFSKLILFLKEEEKDKEEIKPINENNYNELLELLQLRSFWMKELSSGNIKRKKRALRKFDELSFNLNSSSIAPLLQHKDASLRRLARSEFIKCEENDPYKFMEEDFDEKFNRLDEIRIHDALAQKSKEHKLPVLLRWIQNTKNTDYKCFLIREIGYFNQIESAPYLLELFKNSNNSSVKVAIVNTLGMLNYNEALPVFFSEYNLSQKDVQQSIIEAIGIMGKKGSVPFLQKIYTNAYSNEIKSQITKALQKCSGKEESFPNGAYKMYAI